MATIKLKTPDGKTLVLQAPEGASQEEIQQAASAAAQDYASKMPKTEAPSMYQNAKENVGKLMTGLSQQQGLAQTTSPQALLEKLKEVASIPHQKAGEYVAEEMGRRGYPTAGAVWGAGIQSAPDAAMALGTPGVAEDFISALKSGARGAADATSSVGSKLRSLAETITGPGEARQGVNAAQMSGDAQASLQAAMEQMQQGKQVPPKIQALQEKISNIKSMQPEVQAESAATARAAGQRIQTMEQHLGPLETQKLATLMDDMPKARATLQTLSEDAAKGPDFMANKYSAKELQFNRSFTQEMARHPEIGLQKPVALQVNNVAGQALDQHIPGIKDALDAYGATMQELDALPAKFKAQTAELRSQLQSAKNSWDNSKLDDAAKVQRARLDVTRVAQKAQELVAKGKLSDTYRRRLVYAGLGVVGADRVSKYLGR